MITTGKTFNAQTKENRQLVYSKVIWSESLRAVVGLFIEIHKANVTLKPIYFNIKYVLGAENRDQW